VRILQIHPFLKGERINPFAGGKSRASLLLTGYLLEQGHEVVILPGSERLWGAPMRFGVTPIHSATVVPTLTFPNRRTFLSDWRKVSSAHWSDARNHSVLADMFFLAGLRSAVAKFKPALLHVHYTHSDIPALYRMAGIQKPMLLTHHTGRMGSDLQSYRRILFISQTMQQTICRESGYPSSQSAVIYLPVAEIFQQGGIVPVSERNGFAFVGGISDAKGVDLLLETYQQHAEWNRHPLFLCGTGEQESEFRQTIEQSHLNIRLQGRLAAEGIKEILSHARFLVLPSRSEGFSVAIMEALACGTPVIGWAPQLRELEERWGIRIGVPFDARRQTAEDLSEAIRLAIHEEADGRFDHHSIAAHAREEFSLDRFGQKTVQIYEEVRARQ
jgi:glycosyltransferase involved in cell wall biosynthesis